MFVDTDVTLDLLMERTPHFADAVRLFGLIQDGAVRGCTSALSFANLHYLLTRAIGRGRALDALRKLRLLLSVVAVDERAVDAALSSAFSDFEDALQHYAAVAARAGAIVTRNKGDYKHSTVPALLPGEYLAQQSRPD